MPERPTPEHVVAIAEMVADQLTDGFSMHGLVSAEHFGRRYRYSRAQARHVLNNAAEYGVIEKVRVSSLGVDVPHFGARFGFRPVGQNDSDENVNWAPCRCHAPANCGRDSSRTTEIPTGSGRHGSVQ